MTRLYFDTEFTGLHQKTTLISLGIIDDEGNSFYAEFNDYDKSQVDTWIEENVIANLLVDIPFNSKRDKHLYHTRVRGNTDRIRRSLEEWLYRYEQVEMWSDCLSYDWVLFCQLFGHAFNIPKNIYYIPFDICTSFKERGIDPDVKRETFADKKYTKVRKHNSLFDARVIRDCYLKLQGIAINETTIPAPLLPQG